ncbi:MAG: hypothetical protein QOG09_1628 [Solirubrobacterales bacterium]|nr:hypothetical protein [Solirubrobacterales bacterium]
MGPQRLMPTKVQTRGGQRLTAAFEAVERLPALAQARDQVLAAGLGNGSAPEALVSAVAHDPGLAIAVLRKAGASSSGTAPASVAEAVGRIGAAAVHRLATEIDTYDFLERANSPAAALERFRIHARAAQAATASVAARIGATDGDELSLAALLHDIGKLVVARLQRGPIDPWAAASTPEDRITAERRELGIDHALVGGVLARRWGLSKTLAATIERHHSDEATGPAAVIRLADMLAHHAQGEAIAAQKLRLLARTCGLGRDDLVEIVYTPSTAAAPQGRPVEPSPLSGREMEVLRRLAEGKVYKQIAQDLTLSVSTVRTHLHNVYAKLGVIDRAQAVLTANDKGWL